MGLPHIDFNKVDWSRYAYTQYATSETYLCNSIMVFDSLERLGSRAERILFHPLEWDLIVQDEGDRISQLLLMAKDKYRVELRPIAIEGIRVEPEGGPSAKASWDTSVAKLAAFGVVQYERVIHLDNDLTVLQNMDELFFLPETTIAMPRAYWLLPHTDILTSLLAVIQPSYREYTALREDGSAVASGQVGNLKENRFDMEILNGRYGDVAMVLPHKQYGLITGEFRKKDHRYYLGEDAEWNPDKVLAEAKLVHFSDWPLPKPWVMWPQKQLAELQPQCDKNPGTPQESGCRDREVWKELYDDFRRRRKDICKLLSYPAPVQA
ncbi:hypothetical protein N7468_000077 [Penicillium chermesinum]|uniref:Nucleotide-diphospho-sugar transferase n=1 Tax=Penicillium chermesinum TaxID=63820 RepID=A0A9W9PJJ8_9EURO|nr:uncharacterized protein N7468_000077 [Penicillium chermesinum]KAJ5248626.1 hypothetical protein N7468_000077 [Penicillium chermesinum]